MLYFIGFTNGVFSDFKGTVAGVVVFAVVIGLENIDIKLVGFESRLVCNLLILLLLLLFKLFFESEESLMNSEGKDDKFKASLDRLELSENSIFRSVVISFLNSSESSPSVEKIELKFEGLFRRLS